MTFDEYVRARLGALLRTAAAVAGDGHLAEDIVQDVLIKVARNWDEISVMDHRDAYVRRMLVNELISWRRKWGRLVPVAGLESARTVPDLADRVTDRDALDRELQALPRRQRVVLALRYLDGLGDADIAAALGCSETSVRSFASRGLATLRVQMAPAAPAAAPRGGTR